MLIDPLARRDPRSGVSRARRRQTPVDRQAHAMRFSRIAPLRSPVVLRPRGIAPVRRRRRACFRDRHRERHRGLA